MKTEDEPRRRPDAPRPEDFRVGLCPRRPSPALAVAHAFSSLDRCRGTCGARRPIMTTRSDPKRSDRSRWPRATPLDPPYAKKKKPSSLGASTTGIGHPSRRRGAMHRSWTPRAVSSHAPNPGKPTSPPSDSVGPEAGPRMVVAIAPR